MSLFVLTGVGGSTSVTIAHLFTDLALGTGGDYSVALDLHRNGDDSIKALGDVTALIYVANYTEEPGAVHGSFDITNLVHSYYPCKRRASLTVSVLLHPPFCLFSCEIGGL